MKDEPKKKRKFKDKAIAAFRKNRQIKLGRGWKMSVRPFLAKTKETHFQKTPQSLKAKMGQVGIKIMFTKEF